MKTNASQNPMNNFQLLPACVRVVFTFLALALAGFTVTPHASAQANAYPPDRMSYQSYLVDANGTALATNAPKNYDVVFRIWNDSSTTAATNRLWTEQQTVTVDKGNFSVILGEGSSIGEARPALSTVFTNSTASERWVAMTVKGIGAGGADVNILPRLRLLATPYSFLASKAMIVDGAALTSGTVPDARLSANVALRAGGNSFSGVQVMNSALQVNAAVLARGGPPGGNGSGNNGFAFNGGGGDNDSGLFSTADGVVQIFSDAGEAMRVHTGGKVGIGSTAPLGKLEIQAGGDSNGIGDQNGISLAYNTGGYRHFIRSRHDNGSGNAIDFFINTSSAAGGSTAPGTGNTNALSLSANGNASVAGKVSATAFSGDGIIPVGGIILWSGATNAIPSGWALCNGQFVNGQTTPNLTDRFVVGAGGTYPVANTGGAASVTLTQNQMPSHTHDYKDTYFFENFATGPYPVGSGIDDLCSASYRGPNGSDTDNRYMYYRNLVSTATGGGQAHENRPPWYALAYIMRVR